MREWARLRRIFAGIYKKANGDWVKGIPIREKKCRDMEDVLFIDFLCYDSSL